MISFCLCYRNSVNLSIKAGKKVVILLLSTVSLLTRLSVRSFCMFWNNTCASSFLTASCVCCTLSECVCVSVSWARVERDDFNEMEQSLNAWFRWHPPNDCFYSFSCSLHPTPSIKITFSLKAFYTFERNLNIEASGCELFRDLVSSLLPCIILHHCHSTLLRLPTQA